MWNPAGALARVKREEPVRLFGYTSLVFVVGILVMQGLLVDDLGNFILAAIAAGLGMPATEVTRKKVWPDARVGDVVGSAVESALSDAETVVRENFGDEGVEVLNQAKVYVGRHRRLE